MSIPHHGDEPISEQLAHLPLQRWNGRVWRVHKRKYRADDPGGSLRVSGRYNHGLDRFPPEDVWPALYTACAPETVLGELLRHVTPDLLPLLNDYLLTELDVMLACILDVTEPQACGLSLAALCDDHNYRATQALAAEALRRGAEGLLIPSATRLGANLIVLTSHLSIESRIAIGPSRAPRLQPGLR